MRGAKVREIYKLALATYKYEWFLKFKMTFKNYYRKLKDQYVRGTYGKA